MEQKNKLNFLVDMDADVSVLLWEPTGKVTQKTEHKLYVPNMKINNFYEEKTLPWFQLDAFSRQT